MFATDDNLLARWAGAVGGRALLHDTALLKEAGVSFQREIYSGDPAKTLVARAIEQGCPAIIMGARGREALQSALLGSVSMAVLQTSLEPVTFVRTIATSIEAA